MRYFMLTALALLFGQLASAQSNQLTWEEKLSDKYRVDLVQKAASQSANSNEKNKAADHHKKALQKIRYQAATKARAEAKEQRWEREEAIELLVRQRQAEAAAQYLKQKNSQDAVSIQKYETAAAELAKQLIKTPKVWLH